MLEIHFGLDFNTFLFSVVEKRIPSFSIILITYDFSKLEKILAFISTSYSIFFDNF
jgi:hypothetical protein